MNLEENSKQVLQEGKDAVEDLKSLALKAKKKNVNLSEILTYVMLQYVKETNYPALIKDLKKSFNL